MAVRSTRGLKIFLSKTTTAPLNLVPTAVSSAAPAVITVADTTGITTGDIVTGLDTGYPEIDGKSFVVGVVDGTADTFELLGSDTTGTTGALNGAPKAQVMAMASDFTPLCLASIGVNTETPQTVSTATFCDPTSTVPGSAAGAGTIDVTAYHDTKDAGFRLMEEALAGGNPHTLVIQFPGTDGGYLIAQGTVSSWALSDVPLDGAVQWTGQITLSSRPVLRF